MLFKKRSKKEEVITKTITILDVETEEILDIVDIEAADESVEEIIDITLDVNDAEIEDPELKELSDTDLSDIAMMKALRDLYPGQKENLKDFVMDACAAYKTATDEANPDLMDEEQKEKEKEEENLIKTLTDEEYLGKLAESRKDKDVDKFKRQQEIEAAYQARFNNAKKL